MKTILIHLVFATIPFIAGAQNLFNFIEKGDVQAVQKYISDKKDLNVTKEIKLFLELKDEHATFVITPLQSAVKYEQEKILKLLLEAKDEIKDYQLKINQAFSQSISYGNRPIINMLFHEGVDVNQKCDMCYGQFPVQIALEHKLFDIYDSIVKKGANLNVTGATGYSLLHSVAFTGNSIIAQQLIQHGLNINAIDNSGNTPVLFAAEQGNKELFDLFLKNGADLSVISKSKYNIVMAAARGGNVEILDYLISNGYADQLNESDNTGFYSLTYAINDGNIDAAKYLIENDAAVNYDENPEICPLTLAITYNHVKVAKLLIEKGAQLDMMDYKKLAKKYITDNDFLDYLEQKISEY